MKNQLILGALSLCAMAAGFAFPESVVAGVAALLGLMFFGMQAITFTIAGLANALSLVTIGKTYGELPESQKMFSQRNLFAGAGYIYVMGAMYVWLFAGLPSIAFMMAVIAVWVVSLGFRVKLAKDGKTTNNHI